MEIKELYKKLNLLNISLKQKSQKRKLNKKEFYSIYNYDDKNYWSQFLFTWVEPLLNSTEMLFI
ncbi:hypothetical protein [Spiroplasma floricola]|uniref:hypothetical protein n=1 Tax=Spiroplasma floricola TaxID=216937 RepID=UPI000C2D652F|nr:hypothetical protein [Spiroplasma floricola]